jgi:hypothetical protein
MKRSWWHVVKHVLFGSHSPSLLMIGLCWCQRKGVPSDPLTPEQWDAMLRNSSEAAWRGWGE